MSELTGRRTAMKAIALQGDNEYSHELADWIDAACNRMSTQVSELEKAALKLIQLIKDVGIATKWSAGDETDRVFAWYEFDDLRRALGDAEGEGNDWL